MTKKIGSFFIVLFFTISLIAQIPVGVEVPGGRDVSGVTKADVPANIDLEKIDNSDVPAEYRDKLNELKGEETDDEGTEETNSSEEINNDSPLEETEVETKITSTKNNYPIAKVYGKKIFRTGNIKFYEKASDVIAPNDYVIGENDKLSVQVWGFSDYSGVFTVNERGYISPKLIGRVYLKGLTFAQAKSLMKRKFGQILNLSNSEIDITLSYSRINSVNIIGEVLKPGSYKIPAINTAFNALVAAGGPNNLGSVRNIYVKRNGKTIQQLDVYDFLMNPDKNQEVYLQNGDYIFIPIAQKVVEIKGSVKRPYIYELKEGENLNQLIKYAGGLKSSAYKKTIRIGRYEGTNRVLIDLNLDSLIANKEDFLLKDNDVINISSIPDVLVNTVSIQGAVKIPGAYELDSLMRITDLVKKAEGAVFDALTERAYLYRLNSDLSRSVYPFNLSTLIENEESPSNFLLQVQDEIRIVSKSRFKDNFKVFVKGAVRNPKPLTYGKGLNLRDAILMTGGLSPQAANNRIEISRVLIAGNNNTVEPIRTIVKTFQINKDLYVDEAAESFLLEPNDLIIIRSNPDYDLQENIKISGAVMYPGVYTLLSKDEKLSSIITRAGGLKEYAFPEGAKLYRQTSGDVYINLKKALSSSEGKHNIVLEASDELFIPKTLDLVKIQGKIGNLDGKPISGPYVAGKRAGYYIKNYAGGFHKDAKRIKTLAVYSTKQQKSARNYILFRVQPKVKPGSTIVVRQENQKKKSEKKETDIDWNQFFENLTVKLTAVATLWVIISQINK